MAKKDALDKLILNKKEQHIFEEGLRQGKLKAISQTEAVIDDFIDDLGYEDKSYVVRTIRELKSELQKLRKRGEK